jgi:hypothetical protein
VANELPFLNTPRSNNSASSEPALGKMSRDPRDFNYDSMFVGFAYPPSFQRRLQNKPGQRGQIEKESVR